MLGSLPKINLKIYCSMCNSYHLLVYDSDTDLWYNNDKERFSETTILLDYEEGTFPNLEEDVKNSMFHHEMKNIITDDT